jgi:hypothetical protein
MADKTLERVFVRVFTYLTESGVEMTRVRSRALLQLIDDALVDDEQAGEACTLDEASLISLAMDRLPAYFPIPEEMLPAPNPPLWRASIGYPTHD